jgi:hypothetical protein
MLTSSLSVAQGWGRGHQNTYLLDYCIDIVVCCGRQYARSIFAVPAGDTMGDRQCPGKARVEWWERASQGVLDPLFGALDENRTDCHSRTLFAGDHVSSRYFRKEICRGSRERSQNRPDHGRGNGYRSMGRMGRSRARGPGRKTQSLPSGPPSRESLAPASARLPTASHANLMGHSLPLTETLLYLKSSSVDFVTGAVIRVADCRHPR